MKRLCLSICIFLCAAFSSRGAADFRTEALRLEREHYECPHAIQAELLLVRKAEVLAAGGDATEALKTLDRVNLYFLDDTQRAEVRGLRESIAVEPDRPTRVPAYVADALAVGFAVWQICSGCYITGYLCGTVPLYCTFVR